MRVTFCDQKVTKKSSAGVGVQLRWIPCGAHQTFLYSKRRFRRLLRKLMRVTFSAEKVTKNAMPGSVARLYQPGSLRCSNLMGRKELATLRHLCVDCYDKRHQTLRFSAPPTAQRQTRTINTNVKTIREQARSYNSELVLSDIDNCQNSVLAQHGAYRQGFATSSTPQRTCECVRMRAASKTPHMRAVRSQVRTFRSSLLLKHQRDLLPYAFHRHTPPLHCPSTRSFRHRPVRTRRWCSPGPCR